VVAEPHLRKKRSYRIQARWMVRIGCTLPIMLTAHGMRFFIDRRLLSAAGDIARGGATAKFER
jgi:hypothetical protein